MSPWSHLHLSPSNEVLDRTNHIFSESLSSGDDNDRDEYLQKDKDTHTQTKTNTKCFQDPMYAIFIKSRGFKDLKYYIGCLLVMTKTKTRFYALLGLNIFQMHIRIFFTIQNNFVLYWMIMLDFKISIKTKDLIHFYILQLYD